MEDIYEQDFLECMLDDDSITELEEAFMEGYLQAYF